jgi:cation:H+ antiporter
MLVWSASSIARSLGLSEMLIGLTIVAVGTSLPEFASSLSAAKKGEPDIVLGNILGSNLFNTLAAVGLSGLIHPVAAEAVLVARDLPVMGVFTLSLFVFGYGFKARRGHISRVEGALLAVGYFGYVIWLAVPLFV